MMRLWLAVAAALLWMAAPAEASLTLCNRTSYVLYAATATIKDAQAQTQGWTRIVPGDCQVARGEALTAQTYLVHARSSRAHGGPARAWGGKQALCVADRDFHFQQPAAQTACRQDGAFTLPFAPLDTRGRPSWTMTLDETPALPSLIAAQLAGVKRLLHDNGYEAGPIDGNPDRRTGAALAAFRKKMQAEKADNATLFTILEREAQRSAAPAGYTICNDGKAMMEAALAETTKDKSVSRGWWTLPPGACAQALTTPLAGQGYFLFARHKGGKPIVMGAEKFCVAPSAFEIHERGNCPARGQTEAGFLRTQTGGLAGHVAHVGDDGLLPAAVPAKPQAAMPK